MPVRSPDVHLYSLLPCVRSSTHPTSIYPPLPRTRLLANPAIVYWRVLPAHPSVRSPNNVHLLHPSAHPASVCPFLVNRPPASSVSLADLVRSLPIARPPLLSPLPTCPFLVNRPPAPSISLADLSVHVPAQPSIIRHALCHSNVAVWTPCDCQEMSSMN